MSLDNLMSGFVGAALVAVLTLLMQKFIDQRKTLEERSFKIYMMLQELNNLHFWIFSEEGQGSGNPEALAKFDNMRWRIADELRQVDDLPELEEIVHALFRLLETESERSKELKKLIDKLGDKVNPRYQKAIREVREQNRQV